MKKAAKISKEVEAILKPYNEEIKDYIKIVQDKSDADIKRYTGALSEEFKGHVRAVAEQYGDLQKDISGIKKTLDNHSETLASHTEMIGKLAVDMEIVKTDIEFIKGGMKKKVDYDEFLRLERRVSAIESRTR